MGIYVLFNKGLPVFVTSESPYTGTSQLKDFPGIEYDQVKHSRDFKSFEEVEDLAKFLTALTGRTFLGYDCGASTSPRFGVFESPKVGDEVSYAFNGDYYPCGKIVKITKGWRITTSEGDVFNRRKNSPGWLKVGGTWSLVAGYINERNPSF